MKTGLKRKISLLLAVVLIVGMTLPMQASSPSAPCHHSSGGGTGGPVVTSTGSTTTYSNVTSSSHTRTTRYTWYCSGGCGNLSLTETTTESHSFNSSDLGHQVGNSHMIRSSCTTCGYSNTSTFYCPGGTGGACILPFSVPLSEN